MLGSDRVPDSGDIGSQEGEGLGGREQELIGLHRKDPHLRPRFSPFVSWLSSLHSGTASELFPTAACEQMGCGSLHGGRLKKQYGAYCVFFAQPPERWEHLSG